MPVTPYNPVGEIRNGQEVVSGGAAGCTAYNTAVYQNFSQLLTSTVKTRINFNVKESGENPTGLFNLTTDVATIPFTGNWTISFTTEYTVSAGGICFGGIEIDAGGGYLPYAIQSFEPFSASYVNIDCCVTKYLQAGDFVACFAQQNTGFNASTTGVTVRTSCQITSSCIP